MSSLYKSPGVHVESAGDRYVPLERVETGVTAFLGVTERGPRNQPTRVGSFEQYQSVFGAADSYMTHALRGFFDNGGRTAYLVNVAAEGGLDATPDDFIGLQGTEARGLQALEAIEDIDLVVAPDLMFHYRRSVGFQEPAHVLAVQRAMVEHCERLHDRFCLLDPLPGHNLEEVLAPIPPSGHIAGMIARNHRQEGVHRAPANQPLQGLVDVAQRLRKRQRDHAFDRRVNTLVPFPGRGIRIWGARTLSSDPAFVQINVRRLMILLRKSVEKYAQWVVFEPNEPTLWKRIIRSVDVFLGDLWKQGALVGAAQDEAYYVKCDEETNPPEARDAGELLCEIGISPVKPAEFIVVRIHQWTRERTDADKPAEAPAVAAAG